MMHYVRVYVQKDISKAIYYYTQAANQNHPLAQFKIGKIYLDKNDIKMLFII